MLMILRSMYLLYVFIEGGRQNDAIQKLQACISDIKHRSVHNCLKLNPILTGGGGQFDPPLHEIRDCVATAADRDTPYHDFFLSCLTHLLIPSLQKSDHRSRGHATFCTRTSAQNLPKICILHMFVYKTHGNYWFFFLSSKTVFILSLWPFAQFLIS